MQLRAIDGDIELLRVAYGWRTGPKRHTRINRMSFEDFAADCSNKVVMGLFDESCLMAVYVFIETEPKVFEAHFTSRRDANVADVFAGGKTMVNWFHSQGAVVIAEIVERNRPLCAFVEALGFNRVISACQNDRGVCKMFTVQYQSRPMDNSNRPEHPSIPT